jgi:hypothetical protein
MADSISVTVLVFQGYRFFSCYATSLLLRYRCTDQFQPFEISRERSPSRPRRRLQLAHDGLFFPRQPHKSPPEPKSARSSDRPRSKNQRHSCPI